MNNRGAIQFVFNQRTLVFTFGGAILGFLIAQSVDGAIIGGLIGAVISLIR